VSASSSLPKRTCPPMIVTVLPRINMVGHGLGSVYNSKHLSLAQTLDLGMKGDVEE
jgi:hypothetical protein